MRMALFCPRQLHESEATWHERREACRRFTRKHPAAQFIEFDSLEELLAQYREPMYRRIVVASRASYREEFHRWVAANRLSILDVQNRSD